VNALLAVGAAAAAIQGVGEYGIMEGVADAVTEGVLGSELLGDVARVGPGRLVGG
jgi:formaldehyde-activating enzyme involved in methanogenesis